MKKILVIGKGGQLAGAFERAGRGSRFSIVSFNREEFDITDEVLSEKRTKDEKPDILINTAAYNAVSLCEKESVKAFSVNCVAVRNLAKLSRMHRIRFVTFSTDYVFDGRKNAPYTEDDVPNPLQMYGITKLAGEYGARSMYPEGAYIIRTNGLYGGKIGSPQKGNFVLNILKEAEGKDRIEVAEDQFANPTYADHLARAVLSFLETSADPGLYHLANRGSCSWYECAKEVYRRMDIQKELVPVRRGEESTGIRRPLYSVLDSHKAEGFGILMPSWQDGVEDYVSFLRRG